MEVKNTYDDTDDTGTIYNTIQIDHTCLYIQMIQIVHRYKVQIQIQLRMIQMIFVDET